MIEVVAFGMVEQALLEHVCGELRKVFGACRVAKMCLEVPGEAFNPARRQHRSDLFLAALAEHAKNSNAEKVLGVTEEDLYTGSLNFIFGHAMVGGEACIVSLRRLRNAFYGRREDEALFRERAVKEAIHELGHCFSLQHCSDKRCVMVFSNSIAEVDYKTRDFCKKCEGQLKEKS